jgi:hypothetical protein
MPCLRRPAFACMPAVRKRFDVAVWDPWDAGIHSREKIDTTDHRSRSRASDPTRLLHKPEDGTRPGLNDVATPRELFKRSGVSAKTKGEDQ